MNGQEDGCPTLDNAPQGSELEVEWETFCVMKIQVFLFIRLVTTTENTKYVAVSYSVLHPMNQWQPIKK